jgi:hypothetical protein
MIGALHSLSDPFLSAAEPHVYEQMSQITLAVLMIRAGQMLVKPAMRLTIFAELPSTFGADDGHDFGGAQAPGDDCIRRLKNRPLLSTSNRTMP